jgi:heptosyltransferase-2
LESEVTSVLSRFSIPTPSPQPLLGLNPGAEYGPAKRWPAPSFIEAARQIQKQTGCLWLVFGAASDAELAHEITSGLNKAIGVDQGKEPLPSAVNLAGQTSLRELCALLKACRVVLTNDTGPMHVAAAVGTRVVVPFGSTSPALTGPGLPEDSRHQLLQGKAICSPCFRRECPIDFRCMRAIEVSDVVQAVLRAI